ncbi:hypothetical protein COT97_05720 [Candidatus Falkowbacteria bacterium CG10_big_fil_rev_8_21_14_0_10_39_11]|uniref:Uncharacterized protein n=1 Tax=Candidatus Falkowbacteria bacterium CG10_big_fil_rev_8_21_14_0_10_39_11 TaxID=1974565 RepID=A0A2H0V3E9_9BACT|nr:MAG: hypothetical protein COT97_05720 [Candidatus Falkowbacteria bacterium CG10_big_fil_rev_8_21_14_0_10_39_11]
MANLLFFICILFEICGMIFLLPLLIEGLNPITKFGLCLFIIPGFLLGTSSLYMEHSGSNNSVVVKDEPEFLTKHAFCFTGCANIPDVVTWSGSVKLSNGKMVEYELSVEPNKDTFAFFAASLPYNNRAPLSVGKVQHFFDHLMSPYLLAFPEYMSRQPVETDVSRTNDGLTSVKIIELGKEKFYLQLRGYFQPILWERGWQIREKEYQVINFVEGGD